MKRPALLALAAALLTLPAAHAQTAPTKIKTKSKSQATGVVIKSTAEAEPVTLDGAIRRMETLSGIDIYPDPSARTIMLSFTQQFTEPGTLTVTNYKKQPVYTTALNPATTTGQPVDLGRIPAGTYLVEAKTGNYVYWKSVSVKYPSASKAKAAKKKKRR